MLVSTNVKVWGGAMLVSYTVLSEPDCVTTVVSKIVRPGNVVVAVLEMTTVDTL